MLSSNIFLRYEFKYLINSAIARQIYNQSLNFMNLDSYASRNKSHDYMVRSLYYDNDNFDNFFEKADGLQNRKKYRLRTYSKSLNSNTIIYFEMKGRTKDRILKNRVLIDNNDLESFTSLKNFEQLLKKYKNNNLLREFIFEVYRKKLKAKILIDYDRKPLINKFGLYFRLTFDSNLTSSKSNNLFLENSYYYPIKYKPGTTILEVKFERSIPSWFHRIIQSYNLNRKSISKFVLGVCNCKIKKETSE